MTTFICAPISSDSFYQRALNCKIAILFGEEVEKIRGEKPMDFAFRCVLGQWLLDEVPFERQFGMNFGLGMLERCHRLRILQGRVTSGMVIELRKCIDETIPVFVGFSDQSLATPTIRRMIREGRTC